MASITIRRLDDGVKAKLRLRAAGHGRSMEEEAREILKTGLRAKSQSPAQFRGIDPAAHRTSWRRGTRATAAPSCPASSADGEVIILDTNVLSEALKPVPSAVVLRWLAAQAPSAVFTTTITMAEVLYGVEALPPGKRRTRLLAAVEKMFAEEFEGRILPFDEDAARAFAGIVASRNASGTPNLAVRCHDRGDCAVPSCGRGNPQHRRLRSLRHTGHRSVDGIGPTWREGAPTPCAFPVLAKHAQLTARERAPHPLLERVDVVVPGIALAACASQITLGFYGLGDRLRNSEIGRPPNFAVS